VEAWSPPPADLELAMGLHLGTQKDAKLCLKCTKIRLAVAVIGYLLRQTSIYYVLLLRFRLIT